MRVVTGHVVTVVLTGLLAAGAAAATAPQYFGLAGNRPWVWLVPFRLPVGLGVLALAGAVGVSALRWRRLLPAAVVLAVAATGSLAVTLSRGVSPGTLPTGRAGDVTVLAANVYVAAADPGAVVDIVLGNDVDAVSLPEATQAFADDVAGRVAAAGGPQMQVFFLPDRGDGQNRYGTALLVSERLGRYTATWYLTAGFKAVVTAGPVTGAGPPLAAVHTAAPVRGLFEAWRTETSDAVQWCAGTPGALLFGDFNATLDHPGLRLPGRCVDAGAATGTGARGTWPSRVAAGFGATIDHALADGASWRPVGSAVLDLRGSDHRAVLARWRPRTPSSDVEPTG